MTASKKVNVDVFRVAVVKARIIQKQKLLADVLGKERNETALYVNISILPPPLPNERYVGLTGITDGKN